jgi:sugar O-acyltransferase (sialic acid O-acetyltransferase NeuD family)
MKKIFGLVGPGGFGREVIPYLKTFTPDSIYFIDDNMTTASINGVDVLSRDEFLELSAEKKYFNISISNSSIREDIANYFFQNKITPLDIRASNAIVHDYSKIDEGSILCDYTIISPNTKIGKFFHLNRFSQIGHDCTIGDYVTLAPNVNCNGNVIVGSHVYIGTGAIINNGTNTAPIEIGDGAVIGMGAVVTKNVAANTTVVGIPAKPLKN